MRVLVYPFSFILGLGLIPIVTARSHRALHDKAAHTLVLYDWGDGDIERSPLTRWLRGHTVATDWVGPTEAPVDRFHERSRSRTGAPPPITRVQVPLWPSGKAADF